MRTSVKLYRIVLLFVISAGVPCCVQAGSTRPGSQAAILKKWALSRCLSHAAGETPLGDDAAKTAAAYLEMGKAGVEVYEKLDALAESFLARTRTGSVESAYDTMKCIDLFESEELERMARDAAGP